jgi:RNA polymerase sigma-70 factor (ECF subfamily)
MAGDHGNPGQRSDADLMADMSGGDREALAEVFCRYRGAVHRFTLQMTGSVDAAQDLTQEVFIALARSGGGYRPEQGALGTYLYGIARNLVLQREKQRRGRHEVGLELVADLQASDRPSPVDTLEREAQRAALRRAILCLPPHYREVIVLCELHGLRYEDAATIVGCPVGTVRSRLNRARRFLTDKLLAGQSPSTSGRPETRIPTLLRQRTRLADP